MGFYVDDAVEFGNTARDKLLTVKLDKEIARAKQAEAELAKAGREDVGASLDILKLGNVITLNLYSQSAAETRRKVPLSTVSFSTAASITSATCDDNLLCKFFADDGTELFELDLNKIDTKLTSINLDISSITNTLKKTANITVLDGQYISRISRDEENNITGTVSSFVTNIANEMSRASVPPTTEAVATYVQDRINSAIKIDITPVIKTETDPNFSLAKNTLILCNPPSNSIESLTIAIPDITNTDNFKPGDVCDVRFKTPDKNIALTITNNENCRVYKYGRRVNDESAIWTYNGISANADVSLMAENSGFGYVDIYIYEAI